MSDRIHPDDVPLVTTTEEKNEIWEDCENSERPFLVASEMDEGGSVAKYDMYTIGQNLSEDAANEARQIIERWVEAYEDHLENPDEEPDEMWWYAGTESGSIGGLDEADAKMAVSELSEVVLDEDNWVSAKPDFIPE